MAIDVRAANAAALRERADAAASWMVEFLFDRATLLSDRQLRADATASAAELLGCLLEAVAGPEALAIRIAKRGLLRVEQERAAEELLRELVRRNASGAPFAPSLSPLRVPSLCRRCAVTCAVTSAGACATAIAVACIAWTIACSMACTDGDSFRAGAGGVAGGAGREVQTGGRGRWASADGKR